MSAPQSTEQWKSKKESPQYCAVVFQPGSINNLYCLMNHNLTLLLYDMMRYTSGEYVDSYIVGVPLDDNHFDKTLDDIYEEVNQQPDRFTYWVSPPESSRGVSYEETLELWKRLANQIEPCVGLELNGSQKVINPEDATVRQIHGSKILNLSGDGRLNQTAGISGASDSIVNRPLNVYPQPEDMLL